MHIYIKNLYASWRAMESHVEISKSLKTNAIYYWWTKSITRHENQWDIVKLHQNECTCMNMNSMYAYIYIYIYIYEKNRIVQAWCPPMYTLRYKRKRISIFSCFHGFCYTWSILGASPSLFKLYLLADNKEGHSETIVYTASNSCALLRGRLAP